jgi:hypothetical protein
MQAETIALSRGVLTNDHAIAPPPTAWRDGVIHERKRKNYGRRYSRRAGLRYSGKRFYAGEVARARLGATAFQVSIRGCFDRLVLVS